eukprot:TRINITY_DN16248_c0_g1_i1.p1 TRINITY_DN16248_c0_g1~~TRINITY_DN16248_c0_g1_i1.p1  ORF type:complete len:454 (+),score=134.29 TRINITY_DN16248_c0_g1_i1:61-1362(+)
MQEGIGGSQDVITHSLQVENQLLRQQLENLASSMVLMKRDCGKLYEHKNRMISENLHQQTQISEMQTKIDINEGLKDKIIILEAELEKTTSEMQQTMEQLSIAKLENEEQKKVIDEQHTAIEKVSAHLATNENANIEFVETIHSITSSLLPSFDPPSQEGGSRDLTDKVRQSLQFLSEVTKAKNDAVELVRERMKKEILEYKTKASIATHKEEVLQESLTLSESNASREREIYEVRISEIERKHERDLSIHESVREKSEQTMQQLANEVQVGNLEIANHKQTISEQQDLIKKCEDRLRKESSSRSYLQKLLADEKRERDVQSRLADELKMILQLTGGVGKEFTFQQEDLMLMVNKLSNEQGMLEVENCDLRGRVSQSLIFDPEDSSQPDEHQNQQKYQVEVIVNESADDAALTEAILAQNLQSEKTTTDPTPS